MASSKCPVCPNTSFELKEVRFSGIRFNFVQCSDCGSVVGILEDRSVITTLDTHSNALRVIAKKLGLNLDAELRHS